MRRDVDLEVSIGAAGKKHRTRAVQMSEFGMLVGPFENPAAVLAKHVELDFYLPGGKKGQKPLHLKGNVAYVAGNTAGIRFDSVPEDVKAALREFVGKETEPSR